MYVCGIYSEQFSQAIFPAVDYSRLGNILLVKGALRTTLENWLQYTLSKIVLQNTIS